MVVNAIDSPDDERRLIADSVAGIDMDNLLILEEGRRPSSIAFYASFLGGGAALILLAFTCYFMERADAKANAKETTDKR